MFKFFYSLFDVYSAFKNIYIPNFQLNLRTQKWRDRAGTAADCSCRLREPSDRPRSRVRHYGRLIPPERPGPSTATMAVHAHLGPAAWELNTTKPPMRDLQLGVRNLQRGVGETSSRRPQHVVERPTCDDSQFILMLCSFLKFILLFTRNKVSEKYNPKVTALFLEEI